MWAALPERGLFQCVTYGLQEVDVFFPGIAALHRGIIMRGLQRDVTVGGPVPSQGFAAGLRTARTM